MSYIEIIFYLLLIDAIGANSMSWFGGQWYIKHFRMISRVFPASRGWSVWYLLLVLFIGYIIFS